MRIAFASPLTVVVAVAAGLAAAGSLAQDGDIQTTYATEKGGCGGAPDKLVEIAEGRITGPGFDCRLGDGRPAGTGLVYYEATCMVDGTATSGGLNLDLGNYADHFKLALPGREDWLSLYPCTPVPGLPR